MKNIFYLTLLSIIISSLGYIVITKRYPTLICITNSERDLHNFMFVEKGNKIQCSFELKGIN